MNIKLTSGSYDYYKLQRECVARHCGQAMLEYLVLFAVLTAVVALIFRALIGSESSVKHTMQDFFTTAAQKMAN